MYIAKTKTPYNKPNQKPKKTKQKKTPLIWQTGMIEKPRNFHTNIKI